MASSLGLEIESQDMGFTVEVLTNKQPDFAPKIEQMTENPVTMSLMTAHQELSVSTPDDQCEPKAESIAHLSSNTEEADIKDMLPAEIEDIQCPLASDHKEVLQNIIETVEMGLTMRLMVIVSMVAPFADSADTLIHAGDFIMEVTPTTTIREVKYGITSTLEICYEDMALVFVGKFLSDSRTIEYYLIDDGQTLHLLVESPNKLFKDVFEAFKNLDLNEEKAWFATRSFIHVMHSKYCVDGADDNETITLTEELLLHELQQLYVPDSDESDDSSADEDELDINNASVIILGGIELEFVDDESDKDEDSDEDEDVEEEQDNSENENENSEDEDQNSEDDDDEKDGGSDVDEKEEDETLYITSQVIDNSTPVKLFE